ncbi:hypothetical protein MPB2EB_1351 [Mycoavidus sp. B2-EB]|nr:hypothetical protein MPB2EB_1351 [Mycoavidus sp. B2-EB]
MRTSQLAAELPKGRILCIEFEDYFRDDYLAKERHEMDKQFVQLMLNTEHHYREAFI